MKKKSEKDGVAVCVQRLYSYPESVRIRDAAGQMRVERNLRKNSAAGNLKSWYTVKKSRWSEPGFPSLDWVKERVWEAANEFGDGVYQVFVRPRQGQDSLLYDFRVSGGGVKLLTKSPHGKARRSRSVRRMKR